MRPDPQVALSLEVAANRLSGKKREKRASRVEVQPRSAGLQARRTATRAGHVCAPPQHLVLGGAAPSPPAHHHCISPAQHDTMPAVKRKAAASSAPSDGDSDADLEIPTTTRTQPARKRAHMDSLNAESVLRILPRTAFLRHFPSQKRRCLATLAGDLPPPRSRHSGEPASSADASYAKACVGLSDEWHTLHTMLKATVTAQESNSALLIGAAGAGKSLLVDSVLRSLKAEFYHVRLAASVQINDRAAMKEMAQQLILQGAFSEQDVSDAMDDPTDEEESPAPRNDQDHVFGGDGESEDEAVDEEAEMQDELAGAILSSLNNIIAHIIALLSNTASKGARKPLVITLDDFDLFTARPRQALLYCLLDAVQAASYGAGLAVVGMTSRVDTVDLLEKRVKSRFSHRIVHVRPPRDYDTFEQIVRNALSPPMEGDSAGEREVNTAWEADMSLVLSHPPVHDILRGLYELSNDVRMAYRILLPAVAATTTTDPLLDVEVLIETAAIEVGDGMSHILRDLTEPELALLLAIRQLQLRDRVVFNFEMVFDELRRFAARDSRDRQSAATSGSSGSVASASYADRKIALLAFHTLLGLELLLPENYVTTLTISNPVAKPSATPTATQTGRANQNTIRKEFWKVRCVLQPNTIAAAAKDRSRPIAVTSSLEKWASHT
ncbi:hypothetical protein L1887_58671 [Cichorium endivia]|nr:hypothetical protein L1887_58671 [Cichorium endivia]